VDIKIEPYVETNGIIFPNDEALYFNANLKTKYYNFYYSYGRHFKPKNIYEIGVRAGYTAYFLLLGSKAAKYRGIDLEVFKEGSTAMASKLLKKVCKDVGLSIGDSHKLDTLGELYDLIHIDGDHSYEGKVQDLELALANLAPNGVIVIDDYNPKVGIEVKRATDDVVKKHGLNISTFETYTGHAILQR
jgi:predicted O-methyltransferase YrrM